MSNKISFSQLLEQQMQNAPINDLRLPDEWKQGRTAYGGLTAALLLNAIQNSYDDLPPMRSMQITFVGPATGTLKFSHTLLRRGKNTCIIEGRIDGDDGVGITGTFIFANRRGFTQTVPPTKLDNVIAPEDSLEFLSTGAGPIFIEHFDMLFCRGDRPFGDNPTSQTRFQLWMRHRDTQAQSGIVPLIALADSPPPALVTRYPARVPLSSMNWHINMHNDLQDDTPETQDGWWLIDVDCTYAADGYTSQMMNIYNRAGEQVLEATQYLAIFEPSAIFEPDKKPA